MHFDFRGADKPNAYKLLASVVVPRPIALVTSLGPDGVVNAAPFSFFNLVGGSPPVVALGVADRAPGTAKDTRANIARLGEFVVNLVDEGLAAAMNICAVDFPEGVSEPGAAHLMLLPSVQVSVPRLAESPASLECRLHSIVGVGDNNIVLAEVIALHLRDEYLDREQLHVRTEAMNLIGRMHGGGWYARTSDLFDLPRIPYAKWLETENEFDLPAFK